MNFKQTIAGVALAAALVLPASAADVLSVNGRDLWGPADRKSTRLNSSHMA